MIEAAVAAAALTFVVSAVIFGRVTAIWYDKYQVAEKTIFDLNQENADLKQRKSPIYQLGVGGVDPVVRRNRPDLPPQRISAKPQGETFFIDIDDIPKWSKDEQTD